MPLSVTARLSVNAKTFIPSPGTETQPQVSLAYLHAQSLPRKNPQPGKVPSPQKHQAGNKLGEKGRTKTAIYERKGQLKITCSRVNLKRNTSVHVTLGRGPGHQCRPPGPEDAHMTPRSERLRGNIHATKHALSESKQQSATHSKQYVEEAVTAFTKFQAPRITDRI